MKPLALLLALAGCAAARPADPVPEGEAAWLAQLVGEWSGTVEAAGGSRMRETVRPFGRWVLAETDHELFRSLLAVGFDASKQAFAGTFLDTMNNTLWTYTGRIEDGALILEAEGPAFHDPSARTLYRDVYRMDGPDRRTTISLAQAPDGSWVEYARATYRRVSR